jgi:periplasmic divalent cation tolerance protein
MSPASTRLAVVLTTAGTIEQAADIARQLVERRLAACVNIATQVCSIYRWKGKVHQDEEKLLIIKTAEHLFPRVREALRELHTYDLPEMILLPIADADPEVREWLEGCLDV